MQHMSVFTRQVHNLLDCMVCLKFIKSNLVLQFLHLGQQFIQQAALITIFLDFFVICLHGLFQTDYSTQDSSSFVKEVQEVSVSDCMVSYVCSLFTNIPLNETIDLAVDIIFDNNRSVNIIKSQLKNLFVFATSRNHFLFNKEIYDQTDGVAM